MAVSVANNLSQMQRQLIENTLSLASQGTENALQRLQAIHLSLKGVGDTSVELSAELLAASNRTLAKDLVDSVKGHSRGRMTEVAETLYHALRIARGEILVPELSETQRADLLSDVRSRFKLDLSGVTDRANPVMMSCTLPPEKTVAEICADLVIGCRAVQRGHQAVERDSMSWIERHGQTVLSADRSIRIEVGQRMVRGAKLPLDQQMALAAQSDMTLPDRGLATILHSLSYLATGRSIFQGYSARLKDGTAVACTERGLKWEFGQRVEMFSHVFPVRHRSA